ncbi:protein phosphatase 1L-like [Bemisia tabaci]|uniref:protein phosphatase 1L-like n=1 Tax=Bemisia tabaci TaxID=7038 RepID=UPI003B283C2B
MRYIACLSDTKYGIHRITLSSFLQDPVFWSWRSETKSESESTAKHDLRDSKDDEDLVARLDAAERLKVEKQWNNIAVYATIGLRDYMEDTFIAYENAAGTKASFFGVFDGHLGHHASALARDKLMANIVNKVAVLRKCEKGLGSCWSNAGGQTDPTTPSERLHRGCYSEIAKEVWTGCCCRSSPEDWRKQANTEAHSKWWKLRAVHTYIKPGGIIDYKNFLTDVFLSADKALIAATKLAASKAGTTALVAIMEESQLIVANVGDSRGVMCDSKGNTVQLSFDHKPGRKDEMERIKHAGGFIEYRYHCWRTNGNLAVSRALGDWPEKLEGKHLIGNPEVLIFDLSKYQPQFLVLATDGLYDVMTSDQVVAFLLERLHEEHYGAKSLVRHAYSLGAADNITVMVIYLKEHSWESSPKVERASSRRTPFAGLSRRLSRSLKFPSGRKS